MNNGKMTPAEAGSLGSKQRAENIRSRYDISPKLCKQCGKAIPWELRHVRDFCDMDCVKEFRTVVRGKPSSKVKCNKCEFCGKPCFKKFCSLRCQHALARNNTLSSWKSGKTIGADILNTAGQMRKVFRDYLFIKFGSKCSRCGWNEKNVVTGKSPLEVDHIDGNSKNNEESNLTLLCPNCHSITPTYKNLNRGNGRNQRMSRYYEGKTF